MPVAFSDPLVLDAEVISEEYDVRDEPGQQASQPTPAPGEEPKPEGQEGRGVDRIESPGPPPAKHLSNEPMKIDMSGKIIGPDVTVRPDADVPGLGEDRESVFVATPGPGQVMGCPARKQGCRVYGQSEHKTPFEQALRTGIEPVEGPPQPPGRQIVTRPGSEP